MELHKTSRRLLRLIATRGSLTAEELKELAGPTLPFKQMLQPLFTRQLIRETETGDLEVTPLGKQEAQRP